MTEVEYYLPDTRCDGGRRLSPELTVFFAGLEPLYFFAGIALQTLVTPAIYELISKASLVDAQNMVRSLALLAAAVTVAVDALTLRQQGICSNLAASAMANLGIMSPEKAAAVGLVYAGKDFWPYILSSAVVDNNTFLAMVTARLLVGCTMMAGVNYGIRQGNINGLTSWISRAKERVASGRVVSGAKRLLKPVGVALGAVNDYLGYEKRPILSGSDDLRAFA